MHDPSRSSPEKIDTEDRLIDRVTLLIQKGDLAWMHGEIDVAQLIYQEGIELVQRLEVYSSSCLDFYGTLLNRSCDLARAENDIAHLRIHVKEAHAVSRGLVSESPDIQSFNTLAHSLFNQGHLRYLEGLYQDAKESWQEAIQTLCQIPFDQMGAQEVQRLSQCVEWLANLSRQIEIDHTMVVEESLRIFQSVEEPNKGDFSNAYWRYYVALETLSHSHLARQFQLWALRAWVYGSTLFTSQQLQYILASSADLLRDEYYAELIDLAQVVEQKLRQVDPMPVARHAHCMRILGWALLLQDEQAELGVYFSLGCPPDAGVGDSEYHEAQLGLALCTLLDEDDDSQITRVEAELKQLDIYLSDQPMSLIRTMVKRVMEMYRD